MLTATKSERSSGYNRLVCEGLSGTGPKAGGPLYLQKLATERVVSVDTTAAGGNASLMSIEQ